MKKRLKATDFFDPEIQKTMHKDGCILYNMHNETGKGVITRCEVLPGIELFYNDFHMSDGQNENKLPKNEFIEINHCREGRFECEFSNGDFQYLSSGDLSINHLSNTTASTRFPLSHYHGISITIDLEDGKKTIENLSSAFGGLNIKIDEIIERFCSGNNCFVIRDNKEVEHIFSELYQAPPKKIAYYLKIKVVELLMYLNELQLNECRQEKRYFLKNQVETVKNIHKYMTEDLRVHHTLTELSKRFDIPLTSMKNCFKGIYGDSIYSYMKSYRLQAATIKLKNTSMTITEIALDVGYENPSKFSEVFKKKYGTLPSDYRKCDV